MEGFSFYDILLFVKTLMPPTETASGNISQISKTLSNVFE